MPLRGGAVQGRPEERSSPESGRWPFHLTVLAVGLVVLGIGLVLASDLPADVRALVSGLAIVLGGLALVASCLHRFRLCSDRRRLSWLFFAAAGTAAVVGNTSLLVAGLRGVPEGVSLADFTVVVSLLLVVAGLMVYPAVPRRRIDLIRITLDGIVLGGSVLLIAGATVFPQILEEQPGTTWLLRLITLAAPAIDLVLATITWLLMLRSSPSDRPALAAATAGFVLFAVSDIISGVQRSEGPFQFGTPVDLGWIAGYALIALGIERVRSSAAPSPERSASAERPGLPGTLVMFGMLVVAAALQLTTVNSAEMHAASGALLIVVLVAVAARQALLLVDNEQLRRDLEQRVLERSTELREVTQRTDLLVDSVGDGVYGVDSDGAVTFVNPAAVQVLGFKPRELLGRNAHATFHGRQPDGEPYPVESCYVTEAIERGVAVHAEEDTYLARDGRAVPVEVTASPLSKDVSARGAVIVFRDVTHRREVDQLKSEFVSMVSHELKTPLTAIRGSLGLLAGGALGDLAPSAMRMVEIAMDSSERLTRLINQILDVERIDSGAIPMEVAEHPAAELIDSATDQVRVLANQAQVDVRTGIVEGVVRADADRVVQTLLNVLGNAVKFSSAGTEVLVESQVDDEVVLFRIRDQGRGIPPDMLDAIFARFQQVDSSDAREKGGSGLGLAISRSIVERLGGRIWAENAEGGGAVFSFTLPRVVDDHDDQPMERAAKADGRVSPITPQTEEEAEVVRSG